MNQNTEVNLPEIGSRDTKSIFWRAQTSTHYRCCMSLCMYMTFVKTKMHTYFFLQLNILKINTMNMSHSNLQRDVPGNKHILLVIVHPDFGNPQGISSHGRAEIKCIRFMCPLNVSYPGARHNLYTSSTQPDLSSKDISEE